MSKKLTKKTIDAIMKANKNNDKCEVEIKSNGESILIEISTAMTLDEKDVFINRVVNACFDADDEYRPEYRNPVFEITLLQMLTNVPVFTQKIEELNDDGNPTGEQMEIIDIDKTYELCRILNLREGVFDDDFKKLTNELRTLVNKKIDYRKQIIYSAERAKLQMARKEIETGVALVNSIGKTLNETLKGLDMSKMPDINQEKYSAMLARLGE